MNDYANKIHDFEDVNNGDYEDGYGKGYKDGYDKGLKEASEVTNKEWLEFPSVEGVSLEKPWFIDLNKSFKAMDIDSVSIVKDNLLIANDITLEPDDKRITVSPVRPYEKNSIYSLRIFLANGNKYKMQFKTNIQ